MPCVSEFSSTKSNSSNDSRICLRNVSRVGLRMKDCSSYISCVTRHADSGPNMHDSRCSLEKYLPLMIQLLIDFNNHGASTCHYILTLLVPSASSVSFLKIASGDRLHCDPYKNSTVYTRIFHAYFFQNLAHYLKQGWYCSASKQMIPSRVKE